MTTNDKQPTGWVAVDFHDPQRTFWGMNGWTDYSGVVPFSSKDGAQKGVSRVFPWPVPQAVIAMLQCDHPTVDWSQVPVADAPAVAEPSEVERLRAEVEKLTRERDDARAELAATNKLLDGQKEMIDDMMTHPARRDAQRARLDEFAKAALTGLLMGAAQDGAHNDLAYDEYAEEAVTYAQATIRAIDGAGGA